MSLTSTVTDTPTPDTWISDTKSVSLEELGLLCKYERSRMGSRHIDADELLSKVWMKLSNTGKVDESKNPTVPGGLARVIVRRVLIDTIRDHTKQRTRDVDRAEARGEKRPKMQYKDPMKSPKLFAAIEEQNDTDTLEHYRHRLKKIRPLLLPDENAFLDMLFETGSTRKVAELLKSVSLAYQVRRSTINKLRLLNLMMD